MANMRLDDFIAHSVDIALKSQHQNGSFPAGHNGPYHDPDTPVRNTAHWVFALLKCYEWTKDLKYRDGAESGLHYLLSSEARPMAASFWCRKNPHKDMCNGLIGQAWVIETLALASDILNCKEYRTVAEQVFDLHPFDKKRVGWQRVNVDGSYKGVDRTFNHQLWFAAAGSALATRGHKKAHEEVSYFLKNLPRHMVLYPSGLIMHTAPFFLASSILDHGLGILKTFEEISRARYTYRKSIGYHAFNTYALAILNNNMPDHRVWDSQAVQRALSYLKSRHYRKQIEAAPYGIEYNPPGFEAAYTLSVFDPGCQGEIGDWLAWQCKHNYNSQTELMDQKVADPKTSAARIYEATRLSPETVISAEVLFCSEK